MSLGKKLTIILSAILFVICAFIDVWFVYVVMFGETKMVVNEYNVGLQTTTDGNTKHFIEIEYFANEDGKGFECFDLKFNALMDENKTNFFSQGIQYVADSKTSKIKLDLTNVETEENYAYWNAGGNHFNRNLFYSYLPGEETSYFNYASADDYTTTTLSTNPLGEKSFFQIELGDEMFLMQFKSSMREGREPDVYSQTLEKDAGYYSPAIYCWYKDDDFLLYNYQYFAELLFNAVASDSIANGTQSSMIFEFGDFFDYYEYDKTNGSYKDTALKDSTRVKSKMKSYYSIKVTKHADGIKKASESLFNCVQGSSTFNLTNDYQSDDYFYGRTIVECDLYDFEYSNIVGDYYKLALKKSFVDYYSKISDTIMLSICIDLDELSENEIEFFGFIQNSNINKFVVFECYTLTQINGQSVRTEVAYV